MSKASDLANLIGNINAGGGGVNRNIIINGAMNVSQRGTSETGVGGSGGYFVCDRWRVGNDATGGRLTMSQDSSVPTGKGFAKSLKFDCTTADTSIAAGEIFNINYRIEGQDLQGFSKGTSDAKPFAVSFYVKGNASATYCCELRDIDNDRTAGKLFNVTTAWTRVELTFDADTTGTFDDDNARSLDLNFILHAGATYNDPSGTLQQTFGTRVQGNRAVGISSFFDSTDRTFFITGVQLEVGQNPTEFEHEKFSQTLEKCKRYYFNPWKGTARRGYQIDGFRHSSGWIFSFQFPNTMRAIPTITFTGSPDSSIGINSTGGGVSGRPTADWTASSISKQGARIIINWTGTYNTGDPGAVTNNETTATMNIDAEL